MSDRRRFSWSRTRSRVAAIPAVRWVRWSGWACAVAAVFTGRSWLVLVALGVLIGSGGAAGWVPTRPRREAVTADVDPH
jgi:hypothetical protein